MTRLSNTKLNLVDLNAEFPNNHDYNHTDGFHPAEIGLKSNVKSLRNNLINVDVKKDCAISIRPEQSRKTPRPSQFDVFVFLNIICLITYFLDKVFLLLATRLVHLCFTITAMQKKLKFFVNVVSRVIWNQPKLTMAKFITNLLSLIGDVEF